MQLTTKRVAMFAKRPGRYHDGHGLILVVVNANNASWQLRYQRNGRERWFGLGPLHAVTLKDARERGASQQVRRQSLFLVAYVRLAVSLMIRPSCGIPFRDAKDWPTRRWSPSSFPSCFSATTATLTSLAPPSGAGG